MSTEIVMSTKKKKKIQNYWKVVITKEYHSQNQCQDMLSLNDFFKLVLIITFHSVDWTFTGISDSDNILQAIKNSKENKNKNMVADKLYLNCE